MQDHDTGYPECTSADNALQLYYCRDIAVEWMRHALTCETHISEVDSMEDLAIRRRGKVHGSCHLDDMSRKLGVGWRQSPSPGRHAVYREILATCQQLERGLLPSSETSNLVSLVVSFTSVYLWP